MSFFMKRILLIAGILLVASCSGKDETRIHFNYSTLVTNPGQLPKQILYEFQYPGAKPVLSIESDPYNFSSRAEGAVVMVSEDSREKIKAFYRQVIEKEGWRVIQTNSSQDRDLIMSESVYGRMLTYILEGDSPTRIKMYYRRSRLD